MGFGLTFRRCAWYTVGYDLILRADSSLSTGLFKYGGETIYSWSETSTASGGWSGAIPADTRDSGEFLVYAESMANQSFAFDGLGTDSTNIAGDVDLSIIECIADWQCDHDIDSDDFYAFLDDYAAGDPGADVDGDNDVDADDFYEYLDAFSIGEIGCTSCP